MQPESDLNVLVEGAQIVALFQLSGGFGLENAISPPEPLWTPPVARIASISGEDQLDFAVALSQSVKDPESENIIFEVEATWRIAYDVDNAEEYDEETIRRFGSGTAVFNVWPHWREYVMSSAARMQVPFPVVPPLLHFSPVTKELELRMFWELEDTEDSEEE